MLRVQAAGNESGTVQLVGVQLGDLITLCFRERDGDTVTASDDLNGAYGLAVAAPLTVGHCRILFLANSLAGDPVITVAGGTVRDFNVAAWGGYLTTGVLDVTGSVTNGSTQNQAHAVSNITPSALSLIITAWAGTENTSQSYTPHADFTPLQKNPSGSAVDRQYYAYKEAHTGAINPTHLTGTSITTNACCAAFLALEEDPGPQPTPFFTRIGALRL